MRAVHEASNKTMIKLQKESKIVKTDSKMQIGEVFDGKVESNFDMK